MSKPKPIAQVVAVEPAGPDGHGVNWLGGKPPKPGDLLYRAEDINQGRAGLRKAAQTAAEVRGVFAHPDDHQAIREAAKRLADRLAKKRKPATPTKG